MTAVKGQFYIKYRQYYIQDGHCQLQCRLKEMGPVNIMMPFKKAVIDLTRRPPQNENNGSMCMASTLPGGYMGCFSEVLT
jgi:hypothetical protein